jgi:hypothetical protein
MGVATELGTAIFYFDVFNWYTQIGPKRHLCYCREAQFTSSIAILLYSHVR